MPLNTDLSACENWKDLISPKNIGFTNAIEWITMSVGMGSITEDNVEKFATRLAALSMVNGAYLRKNNDEGKFVDHIPTTDELRPYIGLKANVAFETDAKFKNRVAKMLMDEAKRRVETPLTAAN